MSESMTEAEAWRMAHYAGSKFLAGIGREAPILAAAVRSYREVIEQVMAEAGYPVAELDREDEA